MLLITRTEIAEMAIICDSVVPGLVNNTDIEIVVLSKRWKKGVKMPGIWPCSKVQRWAS
jgi:hypothetical protein